MAYKPKILIISDTPVITSGMGRGHFYLASGLHATGKYEVASFGWFWHSAQQQGLKWNFPWKQFTNSKHSQPYGHPDNWPNSRNKDYENSEYRSPIDPWNVQMEYKAEFGKVKVLDVNLDPGTLLFVPAYWNYSICYDEISCITVFQYRTYIIIFTAIVYL